MYRHLRSPLLLLTALLFLSSLACQVLTSRAGDTQNTDEPTPTTLIDQDAIVAQAVATVMAQLPASQVVSPTGVASPAATLSLTSPNTDLETVLGRIYEQVNPAVVNIYVLDNLQSLAGSGSGFVLDTDGHIVTNNHVVSGSSGLEVVFADGARRTATVIGTDIDSDLAVIKVENLPSGIPPVVLGDSNNIRVGQFVVAIGNPFGEVGSLSLGVISGLGRSLQSDRVAEGGGRYSLPRVIQTDAAINPGNSGGPLLNLAGEVIGVNSAIRTSTGTNSGVGFSIPVNAVRRVVPALIASGSYRYPYMGVRMAAVDLATQQRLGLPQSVGALVTDVPPGTPADRAGLRAGSDLIIAANGQPINSPDDMISYLVFETEVGQEINLTILRNGERIEVPMTLGERP